MDEREYCCVDQIFREGSGTTATLNGKSGSLRPCLHWLSGNLDLRVMVSKALNSDLCGPQKSKNKPAEACSVVH